MNHRILLLVLLSILYISSLHGQKSNKKFVISGHVTDVQKNPLTGAWILIDQKTTSIITNDKGFYKVRVRPDSDSITVVTFTNGTSSAAIDGRTIINFTLGGSVASQQNIHKNNRSDEEVSIGYGNVKQKDLLTPVNKIDERNGNFDNYKDIYEILQRTPGVVVSGKSIRIQGGPISINSNPEPLYIVDGVAVISINNILPNTVESISVLKGASASIYGLRGAAGVIIINLRKTNRTK